MVRLVLLDFDGVMTDGNVYVNQDGIETVRCSRRDGHGVSMLREAGVIVEIVSRETNPVVTARARKLRVEVAQGVMGKAAVARDRIAHHGLTKADALFAGDDVFDIEAMEECGHCACPGDAHRQVQAHVWRRGGHIGPNGGDGFVRWLAEALIAGGGVR